MNKVLLLPLFILLLAISNSFAQDDQAVNNFDLEQSKKILTAEINKILKETGIPSVALSLIKGDTVVWSAAFGYANVKKKVPATSSTIYCTGSTFKFVTATAIMQLAEAGKLDIDDPVNSYLGESAIDDLSDEGTPVTFRHLLSHHSGLEGPIEIISLWERKLPSTLEKVASAISAEEPPGVSFKYCNHCYALAGLAIEKISGQSFQEYIVKNILEPLQVESKGPVTPTPSMVEELALPYALFNNEPVPEGQFRFDVFPAGDIYLTTGEMANFLIAQLNEGSFNDQSILSKSSISEMQQSQFESNYSLGAFVNVKEGQKLLYHTGGVPEFSTFFKLEPASKTGVYIASNAGGVQNVLIEVVNLSLKLLKGETEVAPLPSFARKEFEEIQLSEDALKKYTGKYQLSSDFFITVTQKDGHLYAQGTGQEALELFPYEEDKFFHKAFYAQVRFNTEEGKIVSLTLFQNGETDCKKVE